MIDHKELRLEVADALGWKFHNLADKDDHDFTSGYWQKPVGILNADQLPDYPNDPGACARDVLPEMTRRGWSWTIRVLFGGGAETDVIKHDVPYHHAVQSTTLGESICRAFVAACQAEKGQP